jgi:hypothetical protein
MVDEHSPTGRRAGYADLGQSTAALRGQVTDAQRKPVAFFIIIIIIAENMSLMHAVSTDAAG